MAGSTEGKDAPSVTADHFCGAAGWRAMPLRFTGSSTLEQANRSMK
jgi:hypothetical protein